MLCTHVLHIHFHLISWFVHTARHTSPLVFYNQGQHSELFFNWKLSQLKHCCGTYSLPFKVTQTSHTFSKFFQCKQLWFVENPFIPNAMLLIHPPRHMSFTKLFLRRFASKHLLQNLKQYCTTSKQQNGSCQIQHVPALDFLMYFFLSFFLSSFLSFFHPVQYSAPAHTLY